MTRYKVDVTKNSEGRVESGVITVGTKKYPFTNEWDDMGLLKEVNFSGQNVPLGVSDLWGMVNGKFQEVIRFIGEVSLIDLIDQITKIDEIVQIDNITGTVNVNNALYSPSDDLLIANDTEDTAPWNGGGWTKVKEIQTAYAGKYRIKADMHSTDGTDTCHVQVYLNGVALGTDHGSNSGVYVTYSEDLPSATIIKAGDLIQLYARDNVNGKLAYIRNFRLYGILNSSFYNTLV